MKLIEQGQVLFDRYKVVDLIGTGGSAKVYLAEDTKVGSKVALKIVEKSLQNGVGMTEKDLLKELRHSAIPVIVDIEEDASCICLVEEYVEGSALSHFKSRLTEEEVMDVIYQLCDVLKYLHESFEEPIIYRDMKPDNIIRMANGRLKLIDFGIAVKGVDAVAETEAYYGTRGYAAPEQLSYGKVNEKTDIYALGVCAYYLLTGRNLSHQPYRLLPVRELNSEVTQGLADLIGKCTETLPGKRYQSAAQIMKAIEDLRNTDGRINDYEVLKNIGGRVMAVTGIKRGIGVTHAALQLAFAFRDQGKKVALIEWQPRDTMIRIADSLEASLEYKYMCRFLGIDGYYYGDLKSWMKAVEDPYDVVVIDAGTMEELSRRGDVEDCDEIFLVCGSKAWEKDIYEDLYYDGSKKHWHYLFNFTAPEEFQAIRKQSVSMDLRLLPYNVLPYETGEGFGRLFADFTGWEGEVVEAQEKRGFVHETGLYVKTVLESIAKGER